MTSLPVGETWAEAISLSDKYAGWRDADLQLRRSGLEPLVCNGNHTVRLTEEEAAQRRSTDERLPMRGWLAAPLVEREGKNIGLIQLSDKYEGEFTGEDEEILIQ